MFKKRFGTTFATFTVIIAIALGVSSCGSGSGGPPVIGSYTAPTSGYFVDIVISGTTAYLAQMNFGVRVLDVTDPGNITQLGSWEDGTKVNSLGANLWLDGTDLYVGTVGGCFDIIDVSNSSLPVHTGNYNPLGCYGHGVRVVGNTAYLADGVNGFTVLNVTNKASPSKLGSISALIALDQPRDIAISGNTAIVVSDIGDITAVDVTTSTAPAVLSVVPGTTFANRVVINGTTAYCACGDMKIINISNPSALSTVADFSGPSGSDFTDVHFSDTGEFFAVDGFITSPGIYHLDVTDPLNVVVKNVYAQFGFTSAKAVGTTVYGVGNPTLLGGPGLVVIQF